MCCNKNWSLISIISNIYIYISELFDGYQTNNSGDSSKFTEEPSKFSEEPSDFPEESSVFFEDPHPQTLWRSSEFSEDPHPQDFLRNLRIFWGSSSSEFSEDPYAENFLRSSSSEFSEDRIFWGSSEFSEDRHPQNFLRILRIFWGSSSSEFSEDRHPQNFLRILILRIFCGSSSSELSEDPQNFHSISVFLFENKHFFGTFSWKKRLLSENSEDPRKILRMTILRKFWGSSENSEDDDPRKILRILRKFWGWRSSENSEDEDPQKILRMTILRKFWGWGPSENSQHKDLKKILRMTILRKFWGFFRFFVDNHQKFRLITIPIIIGYIRCSSARRSLQKKIQEQSQARSTALLCTQTTRSVFYLFCCFSLTIKAIFFLK